MDTSVPLKEGFLRTDAYQGPSHHSESESSVSYEASEPRYELGLWLQAVRSFFDSRNHPFPEAEQSSILTRNWANEMIIARHALLRVTQLTLRLVHLEDSGTALNGHKDELGGNGLLGEEEVENPGQSRKPLVDLAESIGDVCVVCESLLEAPRVSFYAWATVGKMLTRELDRTEIAREIMRASFRQAGSKLPERLVDQIRSAYPDKEFTANSLTVVSGLGRLLELLRFVNSSLHRDEPLKQTLPIFCSIYEEARILLECVEGCVRQAEDLERELFDALDGLNYAIAMELRKVYSRELVGLSALRESPSIYARVENAHGLLRDCFQQSIVGIAQLFDPSLDAVGVFRTFQTRLEQSLMLRKDLWGLLQLVRQAEKERDRHPISRLLEQLNSFREGSLRHLMYKDWEACERFMEEIGAARGAIEMTPVLHRFSAYLETLLGQVNMRNVLLNHPFDFATAES